VSKNCCTRRKKATVTNALQPYTNQSVFKSLLNCTSEISLSHYITLQNYLVAKVKKLQGPL